MYITKKETIPKTDTQVQNQGKIQVVAYKAEVAPKTEA